MATGRMDKNGEGYSDPTVGAAYGNIRRGEKQREIAAMESINNLIPLMKQIAALAGFEVVGRITLRDRERGRNTNEQTGDDEKVIGAYRKAYQPAQRSEDILGERSDL